MAKYEYGGTHRGVPVQGELLDKVVRECAAVAAMYRLPVCDFDDVVHDALLKCLTKQRFDSSRGVKLWTYMSRIARSAAHDSCQARDLQSVELAVDAAGHPQGMPVHDSYIEQELSHDLRAVWLALNTLPRDESVVIALRFGLGGSKRLTVPKCAATLGVSCRTVERRQARALIKLKEILSNG